MKNTLLLFLFIFPMVMLGHAQIIYASVVELETSTLKKRSKLCSNLDPEMLYFSSENVWQTEIEDFWIAESDTIVLLLEDDRVLKLWRNGQFTTIAEAVSLDELIYFPSLFVHQNDVYISWTIMNLDTLRNYSVVWKNGEIQSIMESDDYSVNVISIYVTDSNIYLAGSIFSSGKGIPTIWINGVEQRLSDTLYTNAARAIVASDTNVYVAGNGSNWAGRMIAKMWINGEVTHLSDGDWEASTNTIYVHDNDIYVTGSQAIQGSGYCPVLWKNGVKQELEIITGEACDVEVYEGDVYVSGSVGGLAVIWKNGEIFSVLSDETHLSTATHFKIFPDSSSQVKPIEKSSFNVTLYPNPATHCITVDLPSDVPSAEFALFDIYGRLLFTETIRSKAKINLPNVASGVYLYRVNSREGNYSGKLVIDRQ